MLLETKQQIIMIGDKQEHSGSGDNVIGEKSINYNYNILLPKGNLERRLSAIGIDGDGVDFNNPKILSILREILTDSISEEQKKTYDIVPTGTIKTIFCQLLPEEVFKNLMIDLKERKVIEINQVQVCYVRKDLEYKLDL